MSQGSEAAGRRRGSRRRVLAVIGTRPEAVKLSPVILSLKKERRVETKVCVTSQHAALVQPVLDTFDIVPDMDLGVMTAAQTLSGVAARVLEGLERVLSDDRPDVVIIEGDTTSVLASAIAAFNLRIPVAHVEAGLRTYDLAHPFPEEGNRRMVTSVASLHLAHTERARTNLVSEGVAEGSIVVTGNPGLDALRLARGLLVGSAGGPAPDTDTVRTILVTAHRRESFGPDLESICRAVARIARDRRHELRVVLPVHPNPAVEGPVHAMLDGIPNVTLVPPLTYLELVEVLGRATLVLTDSGGLQEEAPALGKPVLVMREMTERPEAIEAGAALLVGRSEDSIVEQTLALLDDDERYRRMAVPRPIFGDGFAAPRIVEAILR